MDISHQLGTHQALLLCAHAPRLRQCLLIRLLKFISDHLQKLRFSIVLSFILLYFDDEPSIPFLGVNRIENLAERTLVYLSLEDEPALEEAFLVLDGLRPLPLALFWLLKIKRHSAINGWGLKNNNR